MSCRGCDINLSNFEDSVGDTHKDFIKFLQMHGIVKTILRCTDCGKAVQPNDLMVYRCRRKRFIGDNKVRCNFDFTMKSTTWLKGKNVELRKLCHFVCMWLLVPHPRNERIMLTLDLSPTTVEEWSNYCREICLNSVVTMDERVIGGIGKTVEIHEAKVGKWRTNIIKEFPGSCIFGGLERRTYKFFFQMVNDRSAEVLIDVILRRIEPGTTIISDRLKGPDSLMSHPRFHQLVVGHNIKFIEPESEVRRSSTDRMWREIRSNVPRFGKGKNLIGGYLAEFYWKYKYERGFRLHNFLLEVAKQFDPRNN